MSDDKKNLAEELINNSNETEIKSEKNLDTKCDVVVEDKKRIFQKYKIKDIVFLAIMSACMLITGAIMPLVSQIPIFGIIQICLALQFSIFPAIGMMKIRKPGALLFMSLFCGVVLVFMNPIMFACLMICAIITEALVLLIFQGYSKNISCLFAATVYFPLTLPFLYIYYKFLYQVTTETGQAVTAFINSSISMSIGMSIAVLVICFVGAFIGVIITKELKKSGILKK